MPTYGESDFKESNVNYLNKDFGALKQSLMNYAKSYFPDTYRDFNETSPGMMLLEMNAYVGDVLSFYIDQQYREMLLPLAEERRNVMNMAKMFGYKVKPIVPSFVNLTFTSELNAMTNNREKIDYSNGSVFDKGIEVESVTDSNIVFSTLEPIDFRITGSNDNAVVAAFDDAGLASSYRCLRTVRAVSAKEKTISFQIGAPEKFKKLIIPDTNVIDIISCIDSNGNNWYEVDYLAQDKVPIETHYTNDIDRDSAYASTDSALESSTAVPYSLTYITTPKRFTRETNLDNTTSLVFGNGILNNGEAGVDQGYIDLEQVGVTIPGQTNDINEAVSSLLGNEYSTLGETPNNTTLTITYRVGGGLQSNISIGEVANLPTAQNILIDGGAVLTNVTNLQSAVGGRDTETTEEIKEKAKSFFATQQRCVTKEDYEARILNMSSKFGSIAKVYATRSSQGIGATAILSTLSDTANILLDNIQTDIEFYQSAPTYTAPEDVASLLESYKTQAQSINNIASNAMTSPFYSSDSDEIPTIDLYLLGYNNSKQLVGNPHYATLGTNDYLPETLTSNLFNYLSNFKLMTDIFTINDGYIVNFGVFFEVVAEKHVNRQQVKLQCIQKIKDYFRIEKMQFNQPIYKSKLEYELMGVDGVRSIGHISITQEYDDFYRDIAGNLPGDAPKLSTPTYTYSYDSSVDADNDGVAEGGYVNNDGSGNITGNYGYKYDFNKALSDDKTIYLPPIIDTPTVFELKNPNTNIQGRVR